MGDITAVISFAIVTYGIYKLFELFVCKKERLAMIEKLSENMATDKVNRKIKMSLKSSSSYSPYIALRLGCLLLGMGLGILIGYLILAVSTKDASYHDTQWVYGGSVFFFGGAGLLLAFMIEMKFRKEEKDNSVK